LRVFVDSHNCAQIPHDSLLRGLQAAEQGVPDSNHARPIDFLVLPGGRLVCIVVAPDAGAVEDLHVEFGMPLAAVSAINGADGCSPLSEKDRRLVLRAMASLSHRRPLRDGGADQPESRQPGHQVRALVHPIPFFIAVSFPRTQQSQNQVRLKLVPITRSRLPDRTPVCLWLRRMPTPSQPVWSSRRSVDTGRTRPPWPAGRYRHTADRAPARAPHVAAAFRANACSTSAPAARTSRPSIRESRPRQT
jgi:hypothetical protein